MLLYVSPLTFTVKRTAGSDRIIRVDGGNERSKVLGEKLSKATEDLLIVNFVVKLFEFETDSQKFPQNHFFYSKKRF
jgi:hypothetical protein